MALLTPVVKAFLTDTGSEVANLGMQVFGGHGYIRDNGQEQYVRDARITQIYEGTNGVQAMDFLGRKVLMDGGKVLDIYLKPLEVAVLTGKIDQRLAEFACPVEAALLLLRDAARLLLERSSANPEETGAAAVDFLRLFAVTITGYLWFQAARVALPKIQRRLLPRQAGDRPLLHATHPAADQVIARRDHGGRGKCHGDGSGNCFSATRADNPRGPPSRHRALRCPSCLRPPAATPSPVPCRVRRPIGRRR